MNTRIDVLRPGLFTTIQDGGRWGWQSHGVSVAGPMDPVAFRVANALVGNSRDCAALEVTLTGPTLRFDGPRAVAVSGAVFELFVDDAPVTNAERFVVPRGGTLRFGQRITGARAYLAVAGGFNVPVVLGSRATHTPSRLGGWHGRALASGDELQTGSAMAASPQTSARTPELRTPYASSIRIMPGPDHVDFAGDALTVLTRAAYVVGVDSNRTGFRLGGAPVPRRSADDQLSDVTAIGSLQVPTSGQPILLMADRQTTGGYPRVATVISADIGVAGQAAPGDVLAFELCSATQARAAMVDLERQLAAMEISR